MNNLESKKIQELAELTDKLKKENKTQDDIHKITIEGYQGEILMLREEVEILQETNTFLRQQLQKYFSFRDGGECMMAMLDNVDEEEEGKQ